MNVISSAAWSIGAGIVSGGVAGYLSSVYSAGPVARRQERARRRDQAEGQIHEAVTRYRGRLRAMNLSGRGIFPADYADLPGRELLAERILVQLPMLRRRRRERISAMLLELLGSRTMNVAASRLGVPEADRPPHDWEAGQHEVAERQMRLDYHDGNGCKQDVWRLCEQEHYPQLRADYGVLGLLWLSQAPPAQQDPQ